jgi:hypothetical protein
VKKNDLLGETYMLVAGYIQYNNLHNHCGDFEVLLLCFLDVKFLFLKA